MIIALVAGILVLAALGWVVFLLLSQIEALRKDLGDRLRDNTSLLGDRLDATTKVFGTISENLGRLETASCRIFEIGKDISSLQELLRAPKIRGGLGEYFLQDILSQIIPKSFYQMQYAFRNGQIVDAVIKFENYLVPIDSKFPLENFKAMAAAKNDDERKTSRRQFMTDVKKHIADISVKYIQPGEGTFDFALMYIPAENIYYETIIKDEKFGDDGSLFNYSLAKKVIPVSPNSFYAYLQVIVLGLKGMAIEKETHEILARMSQLKGDFDRFYEDFAKVGKHLGNSRGSFDEAERRLFKLQEKILQIGDVKEVKAVAYEQKRPV
ncbi:MAG: DNA recombination protein RmuC [Candidatus Omnitrophica bacterium]|nr:DNA recombination protein RmuC [Candidatus Omnitrophota bacterium]